MTRLPSDLSSKILTVGPDYRNHRGGVGAVIDVYSKYFEVFNFIPSHKNGPAVYKSFVFMLSLIRLTFALLSDRKIKIIHIHGASYGSFYRKYIIFIIGRYIFRKKIIYHIHGGGFKKFNESRNRLSKLLIKNLLASADIVICLSQSWMEYFRQNFNFKKLVILPNIIDFPKIKSDPSPHAVMTLLFLGLICREKGIFDVVEVIAKNKGQFRTRMKLFIGGNGEVRQLTELIGRHQIEDMVEFLGWISDDRKVNVLNNSDVYILPSYDEGLPVSILESMSYGKAIIATKVGGIPEIVKNNMNGLLIEPGNQEQLTEAIDVFLKNPELMEKYGSSSIRMVQKYLPDSVLNELSEIYKSILFNE